MRNRQSIFTVVLGACVVCGAFAQPPLSHGHAVDTGKSVRVVAADVGHWDEQSWYRSLSSEVAVQNVADDESAATKSLSQENAVLPMTFSHIDCDGEVSILLDPDGPEGQVRALASTIQYSRTDKGLYLYGARGEQPYDVVISGKRLTAQIQSVDLHGKCALKGLGLNQRVWHLRSKSEGSVILRGMFDRCIIEQYADGIIDLYWAKGGDIDVFAQDGLTRLAGAVDHARFRATGDSQLAFQQLRARTAWLQASDNAFATISGSGRLVVFTKDHAQVNAVGVARSENFISAAKSMFVVDDL